MAKRNFSLFFLSVSIGLCNSVTYRFNAEELNSVYYDISLLAVPTTTSPVINDDVIAGDNADETFAVSNKDGQPYHCSVPSMGDPLADLDREIEQRIGFVKNLSLDVITNVLNTLENRKCLTKTVGWWTYEFCYNRAVFQYHLEGSVVDGEKIVLGRFEWDQTFNETSVIEEFVRRKQDLFHSQFYTNGSLCDLSSKLRKAEVRFYCDEDTFGAELSRVDEPETCSYILYIHSNSLCKLPAFLPANKKRDPLNISCRPLLSSAEFELYEKQQEEEKSKKEEERLLQLHSLEQLKKSRQAEEALRQDRNLLSNENSANSQNKNKLMDSFWQKMETVFDEALKEQYEKFDKDADGGIETTNNNLHIGDMNLDLGGDGGGEVDMKKLSTEKSSDKDFDKADDKEKFLTDAKLDPKDPLSADDEKLFADFEKELKMLSGSFYDGLDKNQFRADVEDQYDDLIADARDDVLDEYDPYSLSPFLTEANNDEAVRTLTQTLNKLIDRLDRAEREIEIANEQLEEAEEKLNAASESIAKMLNDGDGPDEEISKTDKSRSNKKDIRIQKSYSDLWNKKSQKQYSDSSNGESQSAKSKDDSSSTSHEEHMPFGKMEIKYKKPVEEGDEEKRDETETSTDGDGEKSKGSGVKVRVSRIKSHGLPEKALGKVAEETQKLEAQLAAKLKSAGLDTKGGKVQVKIITSGYYDEDTNKFHMLTDEESQQFSNVVLSLLGGNEEQKEEKRQKALEDNYNFKFGKK